MSKTMKLIEAINDNDILRVNKLIEDRVNINEPYEYMYDLYDLGYGYLEGSFRLSRMFPLIKAIEDGKHEIAKILLNNGADPNIKDHMKYGGIFTPLYHCLKNKVNPIIDLELFTLLLKKEAKLSKCDLELRGVLSKEQLNIKSLVSAMKKADLFDVTEAGKPSIAEELYYSVQKDYPTFAAFYKADESAQTDDIESLTKEETQIVPTDVKWQPTVFDKQIQKIEGPKFFHL